MKKQYDQVKLHATVMNSKLRNTDEQTPAKKSRSDVPPRDVKKLSFDARNIISVRLHPGGGGVPIMVYRPVLAPPKRGTFLRLLIYERVGISLVEVYERVGKYILSVCKKTQEG